jgi:hypothetical protein
MYTFGENMEGISCKSDYTTSCKAIANDLFKNAAASNRARYEAQLREYAESIDDEQDKQDFLEEVEDYLADLEEVTWYMEGKVGKPEIKNTGLTKAWSNYRGTAPNAPFRGPPEWDLTKWTEEDKKPFTFGSIEHDRYLNQFS